MWLLEEPVRVLAISIDQNGPVNTIGSYANREEAQQACERHWQVTLDNIRVYLTYDIDQAPLGGHGAAFTFTPLPAKPPLKW